MRHRGIFTLIPFIRLGLLTLLCLLLQTAFGQTAPNVEAEAEADWQPPQLADLPADWWEQFDAPSRSVLQSRIEKFNGAAAEAIAGLDGSDLSTANTLLRNLRDQFDLLAAARETPAPAAFEPIATRDSYTLEQLLALRAQWRDLRKQQTVPRLRLEELQNQAALLQKQLDALLSQYNAANENAPARMLLALQRMLTRLQYAVAKSESDALEQRLATLDEQYGRLSEQLRFALDHLEPGSVDWAALQAGAADLRARTEDLAEQLAQVQEQLLAVVSARDTGNGLETLRKQQLTRASARLAAARLQEGRLQALSAWYRLRSGDGEFDFTTRAALEERQALIAETTRHAELWGSASRTTILTPVPETDVRRAKNIELAQSAARETLTLIDEIEDTVDDLGLLHEAITAAEVGMQRGLWSLWTRVKVLVAEMRHVLAGYLDLTLFHVGDAPVTPGSILKMLVILALGLALSRFIRHLLERLKDRRQFAGSPAVYTLGRLLHYIIILVAVFAAFSSIGLDFRNFALIAGALSVGIGFGLQSIVNNFVSGLILLFEGSLRVGDYIELETGLRGIVKEINTRSTLIRTNDNIDMVVPNSHFMTTQLTNWTLREPMARFRIGFGVAYGSDKDEVKAAALEAAANVDFVVKHMPSRQPDVWLVDFGDNALLFELLVWVSAAGVRRPARVRAAVLWELETQLRKRGIEIPFPQRDLHLRSGFLPDGPVEASETG